MFRRLIRSTLHSTFYLPAYHIVMVILLAELYLDRNDAIARLTSKPSGYRLVVLFTALCACKLLLQEGDLRTSEMRRYALMDGYRALSASGWSKDDGQLVSSRYK